MEQEIKDAAAPIQQQDILESILSFVPLIDLAPAIYVSKEWELAISSSLLYLNPTKPWIFFHQQNLHSPNSNIYTYAYDTRSKLWMHIDQPAVPSSPYASYLRSSHSNLLYMLSPSTLSFSSDPFHLNWHHFKLAPIYRPDSIVAFVGEKIIVAGGGYDFFNDNINPLAVEIYYMNSREVGESMPETFKESAASTWVSVATDGRVLYVMDKKSGVMHGFDPECKVWSKPYNLCFDRNGFNYVITFSNQRLIVIGLMGELENASGLKIWSVDIEKFEIEEIGEMPKEMFDRMKDESFQISSIKVCSAGNWVYLYNPCEIGDVYICEMFVKGRCRWMLEKIPMKSGRGSWKTVAVTCSEVGICDVDEALKSGKWTCVPM